MAKQRKFIVGFMHVCMINDWMDILDEQVTIMKESGLYDEMRVCNIGAIGQFMQLEKLNEYIKKNDKLQFVVHSEDLKRYEYLTLRYIKEVCDKGSDFYGFYVHSKGVSYPAPPYNEGGKYWRDYMNHYVIRDWKEDVRHLDLGYDTCGVKYINKKWPPHYSGNFFWFKSLYVKDHLLDVNRMNLKDRFNAEMWICSGNAIAATLCQDFVDYNTKGIFKIPKIK
jgi:hypothetical protein